MGYRWQSAGWVFGLEAQGNWADFSGSNVSSVHSRLTDRTRIDAFGLFTGQVGYAWNNALFYVKGGGAVTDNRYDGFLAGTKVDTANDARWGGTVGAGLEFGFAPNWSAAVEYDHLFMGDQQLRTSASIATGDGHTRPIDITRDADLVTVRVNYRWGGPLIGAVLIRASLSTKSASLSKSERPPSAGLFSCSTRRLERHPCNQSQATNR